MNPATLVSDARRAGVKFRLVDGAVKVSGNAALWTDRLKASRLEVIAYLTREAVNDPANAQPPGLALPAAPELDSPASAPQAMLAKPRKQTFMEQADTWLHLDRAYQAHHFKCPTCKAAGLGYGLRCGVGAALWTAYSDGAAGRSGLDW